ncbi:HopJ type III effector protein [Noviherbaspirillum galbum]|uniref:HopJ type III effector protein n=1 Tax=Noviherbaspirillum galbum TaxID=2709383 RepID=A0A6B3SIV5_9BURK|nr:HopJ type III effector protein [Noviherbaspirillum galbum]NEX60518.1 HopJ type III effector protein [Noviherbaspirillum galbum]
MTTLDQFLQRLAQSPDSIQFSDTMDVIAAHYDYTPAAFSNGAVRNEAGQNAGSCKILAFGLLTRLPEQQVLACFGDYYRKDVLQNPDGADHQNIRNFMKSGWAGVRFDAPALAARAA